MKPKTTLLTTIAVNIPNSSRDYIAMAINMVNGYLEYTNFDVLIVTNEPAVLIDTYRNEDRVHLSILEESSMAISNKHGGYDENIKLLSLLQAYNTVDGNSDPYDVIYSIDADLSIKGFDIDSYNELINVDSVDLWTTIELAEVDILSYTNRGWGVFVGEKVKRGDIKDGERVNINNDNYIHICPKLHAIREDRLIYTNRVQLGKMLNLYQQQTTWHHMIGEDTMGYRVIGNEHHKGYLSAILGESAYLTNTRVSMVDVDQWEFAKYEDVVDHTTTKRTLNRSWIGDVDTQMQKYIKRVNTIYKSQYNKNIL